jgi:transcriptional regulator with XRE-family HTH domain
MILSDTNVTDLFIYASTYRIFISLLVTYFYTLPPFYTHKTPLSAMKTGKIISDLREAKGWNQSELADKSGVSRVMIGKYERADAVPSIDAAKKIADALDVTLDFLVGEGANAKLDKKTVKRLHDIELLESDKRNVLFDLIDTYIRDAKIRKAHAG